MAKTRDTLAGLISAIIVLHSAEAAAQTCTSYPNTLQNGQTADATQVMANLNCAALLGGANFTGPIQTGPTGGEATSINVASFAFNRRTYDGYIYNPSASAYQWQHFGNSAPSQDYMELQVYAGNGTTVAGAAIAINGNGSVSIGGGQNSSWLFTSWGQSGGTTSWATFSDARLKTEVTPITGALSMVDQLNGVRFRWLSSSARVVGKEANLPIDTPQIGFLAQDVMKVVPEAVVTPADAKTGTYGLMESKLIPILVEAIKEQQKEIVALQAEIATLRGH